MRWAGGVGRNLEFASHGNEELVAGLMRMPAARHPGLEIIQVKFTSHLEWKLFPGLTESQSAALIAPHRQFD